MLRLGLLASGEIAIPMLEKFYRSKEIEVLFLVTQIAKPIGRKQILTPTKVGQWARENAVEYFEEENVNSQSSLQRVNELNPDILLVFSFGQILSQKLIDIAKVATVNIHGSLLPSYRGASPINQALIQGDKQTGISVMKVVKALDQGGVYIQHKLPIFAEDTYLSLRNKMARLVSQYIERDLLAISSGKLIAKEQDEKLASYTSKITKKDGLINWREPAEKINRRRRAYYPFPGIYFIHNGKRLQITNSVAVEQKDNVKVGTPVSTKKELKIKCGADSYLHILEVLPEGKKRMSIEAFLQGNSLQVTQTI